MLEFPKRSQQIGSRPSPAIETPDQQHCITVRTPTPPSTGTLLARAGATVRPSLLIHDDIRICIAQRVRPPPCVLEEERLLCASDKVCAWKRTRHYARRLVTAAGRGAEDRTVDMWMPKPKSEGQLSTRRDAQHRGNLLPGIR